jgi:hypothetical protein
MFHFKSGDGPFFLRAFLDSPNSMPLPRRMLRDEGGEAPKKFEFLFCIHISSFLVVTVRTYSKMELQPLGAVSSFEVKIIPTTNLFSSEFPFQLIDKVPPDRWQQTIERINAVLSSHHKRKIFAFCISFIFLFLVTFIIGEFVSGWTSWWLWIIFGLAVFIIMSVASRKSWAAELHQAVAAILAQENAYYNQLGIDLRLSAAGNSILVVLLSQPALQPHVPFTPSPSPSPPTMYYMNPMVTNPSPLVVSPSTPSAVPATNPPPAAVNPLATISHPLPIPNPNSLSYPMVFVAYPQQPATAMMPAQLPIQQQQAQPQPQPQSPPITSEPKETTKLL